MAAERRAQGGAAGLASPEDCRYLIKVHEAQVVSFSKGAAQRPYGHKGGHVEERPRDRCHRQAAMKDPVEVAGLVDLDAANRIAAARDAYMDRTRLRRQQPPPPGGGGVAESGAGSEVEQGGSKSSLDRERRMANRVDTRVNTVQAPRHTGP